MGDTYKFSIEFWAQGDNDLVDIATYSDLDFFFFWGGGEGPPLGFGPGGGSDPCKEISDLSIKIKKKN